jgi:galactokinase
MGIDIQAAFTRYYGMAATYIARAPGRVNLIGEHTDYNDGFVLPMAINRSVWVAARPREDGMINVYSGNFKAVASFSLDQLKDDSLPHWTQHLRGVWHLLGERRQRPGGVDVYIEGNIPIGAGLSSSAAIEVALTELGLAMIDDTMTQAEKALFGVDVEHQFIKMPCGIMDQTASAVSEAGHALLIDCRTLETTPVYLPKTASIVVLDTKKRRRLVEAAYAERRQQCEESAKIMEVSHLRDADLDMLSVYKDKLGPVRYRRAHHIVTENARTLDVAKALTVNNLEVAGRLMNESHYSLRDDYEVSCQELDVMSMIARKQATCYGTRMTGAGFGGCVVALVSAAHTDVFMRHVHQEYEASTQITPDVYVFEPANGSEVLLRP